MLFGYNYRTEVNTNLFKVMGLDIIDTIICSDAITLLLDIFRNVAYNICKKSYFLQEVCYERI